MKRNPTPPDLTHIWHAREQQFARYLTSRGEVWEYHTRLFSFGTPPENYTPDFWVPRTGMLYEVIGSRQALHQNHAKLVRFLTAFPKIKFQLVTPLGEKIKFTIQNNQLIYTTPSGQKSHLKTIGIYPSTTLIADPLDHSYVKHLSKTTGRKIRHIVNEAVIFLKKKYGTSGWGESNVSKT